MQCDGEWAGTTSSTNSPGVMGDHQRTTLSFLAATFAVAVSAFAGLGQAAAAPSADSVSINVVGSDSGSSGSEPTGPSIASATTVAATAGELRAALAQLQRLPGPTDRSTPRSVQSTDTMAAPGTSIPGTPNSAGPTVSPGSGPATAPATGSTATTTSTTSAAAVTEPPTMAIRKWRPVSRASFERFVEARDLTTVEFLSPGLVYGTIVEHRQRVNVVLVHRSATAPMRVSPVHRGREPVGEWARAVGATAGINANWYSPFDGPAVAAGKVYGGSDHGYTALFGFTADGDLVADHHHKIHSRVDPRVVEAVSGHPTLIHRGVSTVDFGNDPTFSARHPRTAIGVSASVDVLILVTVDGRRTDAVGMTGVETTRLLERLGAHDAVMLDGGGSSAMWIAGRGIVNRQSDPGRAVGNQIAVFAR